ncbi:hypothetical protein ACOSQ2_019598 [Xanthoceras sorbifolium]
MIAKSLNFNFPIKLTRDNYIYWKTLVLPSIRALELEEFITCEKSCPAKFVHVSESEIVISEDYLNWKRLDQFLLGWLLSTISENLIGEVTECQSSLEAWKSLESLFSKQSMAKALQLRQQIQNLKKGSSSIADFVIKIKGIGDSLRSAGEVVTDRELLLNVLSGLGMNLIMSLS